MQRYWPGILTVVLSVFCAWWFTVLFERYEEEVDVGYSQAAKQNPYLAAQHFLEKNQIQVHQSTATLDFNLISPEETVFLSVVDSMLLSESQISKALAWVEKGGLLIVGAAKEVEGHDSLLSRFDIEPKRIKKKTGDNEVDGDTDALAEALSEALNASNTPDVYTIDLAGSNDQLKIQLLDKIVLSHPEIDQKSRKNAASKPYQLTTYVGDNHGARLLQFDYGEGELMVLSSTRLWQNQYIGKADHAYLLAYLMPKATTLHLFYNVDAPPLWHLIWRYGYELIIACAALLALWLWRVSLRVQSAVNTVDGQRRNFTEHLTASAEFLAAKKQYLALITPISEDIHAQMQRYHPGFAKLAPAAQSALIAQRVALSEDIIQQWLEYTSQVNNQQQLIDALTLGNTIRRKL